MKRILFVLALMLLAVPVFAGRVDRDILLSADGRLFTIESQQGGHSQVSYLTLTITDGANGIAVPVPASLGGGTHTRPALAFDSESDTLFIFWQKAPNAMSSELLFCSYQNGKFSPATSIDSGAFRLRYNLDIAVTKFVEMRGRASSTIVPGLTVHATWWEETGVGEVAKFAMVTIEKGAVTWTHLQNLSDFIDRTKGTSRLVSSDFDPAILRHPTLFENASRETVDVVFGEVESSTLHRVTLRPVSDGRIRIPVGVKEHGHAAPNFRMESTSTVGGLSSGGSAIALYVTGTTALQYSVHGEGGWSTVRSIALSDKLTADAAVSVLRRMLESE